ncbi:MAG: DUF262 domain-containing protein [Gammaproteobacteria bacterium]|nr:MAG: DUF262 domain-containing protein [Gammaproteobacteria bacterium]
MNDVDEKEVERWFAEEENEVETSVQHQLEDAAEKYSRSQLRVVRESKDYQLDYLRHALSQDWQLIDTSPSYQRRLRWSRKKRSLLIESFLLNIPVPPVFLYERDYNEYEVIDGRQRLEAIKDFLSNDYALLSLEYWPELNGKRFNSLPPVLQKGLLRRSLSAVVLLAETRDTERDDLDVRRVLFDRLNTGGTKLNPQELRNALFPGRLNVLLTRLARNQAFTATWGIPPLKPDEDSNPPDELLNNTLYKSLADAELVLRFFALQDTVNNKRTGSLRKILDRFMEKNALVDQEKLDELEGQFVSCIDRLFNIFEGKPFRLPTTGRPSRPLYDALMVALSRNVAADVEANAAKFRAIVVEALNDPSKYEVLVGRGNTIDAIKNRISLAEQMICEAIK